MMYVPYNKYDSYTGVDLLKYPEGTIFPVSLGNLCSEVRDNKIHYLKAHASVETGSRINVDEILGSDGPVDVSVSDQGVRAHLTYGTRNPVEEGHSYAIPLKDLLSLVMRSYPVDIPLAKEIIVEYEIPEEVRERPVFEDSEKVYHHLESDLMDQNTESKRRGLQLTDLYKRKREMFEETGLKGADDPMWFRAKERSRLVTVGLVTDDGKTHEDIVEEASPNDLKELLASISGPLADVGVPRDISGAWEDHSVILYQLDKFGGDL